MLKPFQNRSLGAKFCLSEFFAERRDGTYLFVEFGMLKNVDNALKIELSDRGVAPLL